MKRFLALLAAAVFGVATAGLAGAQSPAPRTKERIVIQVSTPEPRMWNQALNYVENLQDLYGKENVSIEIVALGHGIGVLKLDSPLANRVADAVKRGASIQACQVTMRRQSSNRPTCCPTSATSRLDSARSSSGRRRAGRTSAADAAAGRPPAVVCGRRALCFNARQSNVPRTDRWRIAASRCSTRSRSTSRSPRRPRRSA